MSYSEFESAVKRRLLRSSIRLGDSEVAAGINRWWNRAVSRGLSWEVTMRRCVEDIKADIALRPDGRSQGDRTVECW